MNALLSTITYRNMLLIRDAGPDLPAHLGAYVGTITRPLHLAHNRPDDGPNGGPKPEVNCDEDRSICK
jgi:hypothetical protein